MIVFLVSAPLRLLKGRGVLAAMRPGSQTAQPLHSEPVRYGPWSDSRVLPGGVSGSPASRTGGGSDAGR